MKVYIIGSLRNPEITDLAAKLRALPSISEVFDDWHSGGPEVDDEWQAYERKRGRNYKEALRGYHAQNVFKFDKAHIDSSDAVVLLMPAGKSGHLELGYAAGIGLKTYILLDKEPDRYDIMYNFATDVFLNEEDLLAALKALNGQP